MKTDNLEYLKKGKLSVRFFEKDVVWQDTGTHKELLKASNFVEKFQKEQGEYVGCLEEIAYKNEFISKECLLQSAEKLKKTEYGQHLLKVAKTYGEQRKILITEEMGSQDKNLLKL